MTFYFAWVGGAPIEPLSLLTKADVWGGDVVILGSIWGGELNTSGDLIPGLDGASWDKKVTRLNNLRSIDGLVSGQQYLMTGNGLAVAQISTVRGLGGVPLSTGSATVTDIIFTYDGVSGGTVDPAVEPAENISIKLASDFGTDTVVLTDVSPLTIGQTYFISGSGIADNTTFTFSGSSIISISNPATKTGMDVPLTISTDVGRNIITNLASASGLVVGETYQVFGRGLSGKLLATYEADGTLLLSGNADISTKQTPIRIFRGTIYPDGGDFDAAVHARSDEQVLSVTIDHSEGNFAFATIELKNPKVGLLSPGRNVWCWLSWQEGDADTVVPLFHGRLVAVPSDLENEAIRLEFIAQPADYENLQEQVMSGLRDVPYWDPIWYNNGVDDATTILEARTSDWHIDRVRLEVSVSDMTIGEDGTLAIGADQDVGNRHIYSSLKVKFGNAPLSAVYMTGSVTWTQSASGTLDITDKLVAAFKDGGSPYSSPNISSYMGDGLLSSWPKPLTGIGGGWTVGLDTSIIDTTDIYKPKNLETRFTTSYPPVGIGAGVYVSHSWDSWATLFTLNVYSITFTVNYEAKRSWTENVSFFLAADVQQIHTDSRGSVEEFSLSSSLIEKPIDPGGFTPLGDPRYNTYFKTSRGQDSFKFLLAYARAKLVTRARAIEIEFTIQWKAGLDLSCRKNVVITDSRLPGGSATGKVIGYKLVMAPKEGMRCDVKIGCTIGKGGSVAATDGEGVYALSGYMKTGYQATIGGTVDLGDNTVTYQNFDDFEIMDDGLDFFTLSASSAIKRIDIVGNYDQQRDAISMTHSAVQKGSLTSPPDPVGALKDCYTLVTLELYPVTGGDFLSQFAVDVSKLQIPKTIDLESA